MSVGPSIRELNCLWTRRGRPPLWISAQIDGRRKHLGLAVGRNVSRRAPFGRPRYGYITRFVTAREPGAMATRVAAIEAVRRPK